MSKISIQDKINDTKIRIDKTLFEKDVFFVTEKKESDDNTYVGYIYLAAPNNNKKFGVIAFDEVKNKIQFIVLWVEMTERNILEAVEEPETYIFLNSEKEFVEYFTDISLTKILKAKQ